MFHFIVFVHQLCGESGRLLHRVGVKEEFEFSSLPWRDVVCAKLLKRLWRQSQLSFEIFPERFLRNEALWFP